jgi:hypothetical protein
MPEKACWYDVFSFFSYPFPDLNLCFLQEVNLQAFWHQPQPSPFRSADSGAYSGSTAILPAHDRIILHVPSTTICRLVVLILLSAIFGIIPLTAQVWEVVRVVGSGLLDTLLVLYYLIAGFN